jgi:hypothetical protein
LRLEEAYRVTTFVPPEHLDAVLQAILAQAPLAYGPYDKSAWWSAVGTEQFEPRPGAQPAVGEVGKTERVPTIRLEFVIPREPELLNAVLAALTDAHPWQEPAVFIDQTTITVSNPRA